MIQRIRSLAPGALRLAFLFLALALLAADPAGAQEAEAAVDPKAGRHGRPDHAPSGQHRMTEGSVSIRGEQVI